MTSEGSDLFDLARYDAVSRYPRFQKPGNTTSSEAGRPHADPLSNPRPSLPLEFEELVRDVRLRSATGGRAGDRISIHISKAAVLIDYICSLLVWVFATRISRHNTHSVVGIIRIDVLFASGRAGRPLVPIIWNACRFRQVRHYAGRTLWELAFTINRQPGARPPKRLRAARTARRRRRGTVRPTTTPPRPRSG